MSLVRDCFSALWCCDSHRTEVLVVIDRIQVIIGPVDNEELGTLPLNIDHLTRTHLYWR